MVSFYYKLRAKFHKSKLYVDAQHGLGNRMRALASGSSIAVLTDRKFVVVWQPDHHCDCHFHDLFDYDGEVQSRSFVKTAYETMDVTNYMEIEEGSKRDAPVILRPGKDAYLRSAYYFNSEFSQTENELAFMRGLKPARPVKQLIDGVEISNCIGVHVRMEGAPGLDQHSYDSQENWPEEDQSLIQHWREKSHYSRFIKRVDELLDEEPARRIYLAADLQQTYDAFLNRYGKRVVCLQRKEYDRSARQIQHALADAILLSRTPILLGSYWSSFSQLAKRLSRIDQQVEFSGKDF